MNHERRAYLLNIVANAAKSFRQWVEHGSAKILSADPLYQRFQEIADQALQQYIPGTDPLGRLYLDFAAEWRAFIALRNEMDAEDSEDAAALPSDEFWIAWVALRTYQLESIFPMLKRIESIAELLEEKVPKRQICIIYGFMLDDGYPDLERLAEEIAQPGTHTGPGWVAPVNRLIQAKIEQAKADEDDINRRRKANTAHVAQTSKPAPETIEQLVADGLSATQISKMKRLTVEQVYAYCHEHGLPQPHYDYTQLLRQPGPHDPEISPDRQAAMDRLGQDTSPQFSAPRHPSAEGPYEYVARDQPAQDDQASNIDDDSPSGIDLSDLEPEEANQVEEAAAYFQQGMQVADIAQAMGIHGNKVRSLLNKAGVYLSKPAMSAGG